MRAPVKRSTVHDWIEQQPTYYFEVNIMTTTMNSGHSENVKGPHKGPVTQAAESFFESIRVRQGKQVGVTTGFAVALEACMRKAMKGDLRALAQIMEFIEEYQLNEINENNTGLEQDHASVAAGIIFKRILVRQGDQVRETSRLVIALQACMHKAMAGDLIAMEKIMDCMNKYRPLTRRMSIQWVIGEKDGTSRPWGEPIEFEVPLQKQRRGRRVY